MEKTVNAFSNAEERDFDFKRGLSAAAVTFFLAVSPLFGRLSPFPAAVMGALSGYECISAFFGAVIGFIVTGSFELSIPHVGAMTAILALRLIAGNKSGRLMGILSSLVCSVCVFIANLPSANEPSDIFMGFAFGIITFISVMSLSSFSKAADKPVTRDNSALLLSGGVIYALIITAFTGLHTDIFNLGVSLSALCIVLAPYAMTGTSAAVGILSAVGITAADSGFAFVSVILALSSLVTAVLNGYGRITRACALVFTLGAGVIITGVNTHSMTCTASALIGAAAAMIIPERFIPTFKNRCRADISASKRPFYAFGCRLSGMGSAIGEMNSAIKKTAEVLDKENLHDPSEIYISAAEAVCTGCKNNMHCWGSCYNRSADIMNKAVANIRSGRLADESMLTGHFEEICTKRRELSAELNKRYAVFCSAKSAARKIGEMRRLLSSQLSSTRLMLEKAAEELCCDNCFDDEAAQTAENVLRENGLISPVVTAVNIEGRLIIDAYGDEVSAFDPENIAKKLSFALHKELDPPMITECGERIHLTLSERSVYDAQIRIFTRGKGGSKYSGDCCDCFNDGYGNVYMILSDGMGSGSRAGIDSAFSCSMLSKMLKAGIDFDASMEMLNTSLLVKSQDESFATLDVCRINLCNGEISLYKAGSASTFVKCGNEFAELSGDGVPLGVEFDAEYSEKRFIAAAGDVIIMASDGADIDKKWLKNILMRDKSVDLSSVIDTIGEALRLSAEKGKEDDITVIGVKIVK